MQNLKQKFQILDLQSVHFILKPGRRVPLLYWVIGEEANKKRIYFELTQWPFYAHDFPDQKNVNVFTAYFLLYGLFLPKQKLDTDLTVEEEAKEWLIMDYKILLVPSGGAAWLSLEFVNVVQ